MGRRNGVALGEAKMHDKYQGESDLRTLKDAEEIRGDEGRMRRARKHHAEQTAAMAKVGARLKPKRAGSKVRR